MEFDSTFTCCGKVNSYDFHLTRSSLLKRDELETITDYTESISLENEKVLLFGHSEPASAAILHLEHFTKCMEMQMRILSRYEINRNHIITQERLENDFFDVRKSICDFVLYVRTYLISIAGEWPTMQQAMIVKLNVKIDEVLNSIRMFLNRLKYIPPSIFHYVVANTGNQCNQPEFHLYHTHLELRWLIVTLVYVRTIPWQDAEASVDQLDKTVRLVIDDVIYISSKLFERTNISDLGQKNPYSCSCVRDLWLMLQTLLDNISTRFKGKTFWECVNISLNGILNPSKEENAKKLSWYEDRKLDYPEMKNPELFCTWMIYHLTLLYGYNQDGTYIGKNCSRSVPNHDQIDKVLKSFLNKGGKEGDRDEIEEELRIMIPLLKTIDDWWPSRITIIALIWDCFHRRLDQPFLIQTTGPWLISLERKTPFDILKQVRARIELNFDASKESSYGLFLRFLGMLLEKSYKEGKDVRIWTQLKGRILSKFQKKKIEESTEAKMYNFISLFLTLAITADTASICTALLNLLPSVLDAASQENTKRTSLNFKCQLACLVLYTEKHLNIQPIAEKIINIVDVISCRKDELSRTMMSSFVETLNFVLLYHKTMDNGEYSLIGGWIDRYLLECSRIKVGGILKLLIDVFDKAKGQVVDCLWFIAARIRTMVFDAELSSENYQDIARLGAFLTFAALENPAMANTHRHSAVSLFQHFTSTIKVKDVRVTIHYLSLILDKHDSVNALKKELKDYDIILIQAWIKACIFKYDSSTDEMFMIKSHVVNLKEISQLYPAWKDAQTFKQSETSITSYFIAIANRRNSIPESEWNAYDMRIRMIFKDIDKWVLTRIKEEDRDSELASWIFRCLGMIIRCCGFMLHIRNQPISLLKNFITKFVFFSEEQAYLKIQAKKIFSLVILGLEAAGARNDITFHGIIINLFETYLPLLVQQSEKRCNITEPLLRSFIDTKADFSNFLIEKISSAFITMAVNNGTLTHKICHLVMSVYENFLTTTTQSAVIPKYLIESIIVKALPKIIDVYVKVHDHHPHKSQVYQFISALVKNVYYKNNELLQDMTKKTISKIITNQLTYKPQASFELLRTIAELDITIVQYILPTIQLEVSKSEHLRRPNAQSLRYTLDQFLDNIKQIKSR